MSRWRMIVIWSLLVLPLLLFVVLACWAMWKLGWFWWLWLLMPVSWGVAVLLARWWKTDLLGLPPRELEPSLHWTPRDEQAWELVQAHARNVKSLPAGKLTELGFYSEMAGRLALELARLYHPTAKDPFGSLTIPEILAAAELAAEDLTDLVAEYLPGGHVVTVKRWRNLSKLPGWYETFERWYWPISTLIAPHTVVGRYAASRWVLGPAALSMQANVVAWFYVTYVQEVGRALIELNSGRLKGGARRFRETRAKLLANAKPAPLSPPDADPARNPASSSSRVSNERSSDGPSPTDAPAPHTVTIALAGQVKAGKSSLINALLRSQRAATDVLPLTSQVTRYRLEVPDRQDELVLLDTIGYGVDGPDAAQVDDTWVAVRQSDLLLLVIDVTSPARQADVDFLRRLDEFYHARRNLKPPPILAVLTHIDLLSPVMEWSPPYDWKQPSRPKERTIHDAVAFNVEQLHPSVEAVIPLCTDLPRDRVYGVEEWLLPAMSALLGEALAVSLVRTLHEEIDRGKVRRAFRQFWSIGRQLVRAGIPERLVRSNPKQLPAETDNE